MLHSREAGHSMENPATVVFGVLIGLAIGVPFLALIMYGSFTLGQSMADRFGRSIRKRWAVPLLCLFWFPLLFIGWFLPGTDYMKGVVGILVYLLNTYPNVIGFMTRLVALEVESERRFHKNVDDWLGDWECQESDDDGILHLGEDEKGED